MNDIILSSTLKKEVWDKYIGHNIKIYLCFYCKTELININKYRCNCIDLNKNLNTLRPICKSCNAHIGRMNNQLNFNSDSKHCVNDSKHCVIKHCVNDSKHCVNDSKYCVNDSKHCVNDSKHCVNERRYMINSRNIKKYIIILWAHCLHLDPNMVKSIKNAFQNKTLTNNTIYIAKIDNKFICYDGNHTIEALNDVDYNLLCHVTFNCSYTSMETLYKNMNSMKLNNILCNSAKQNQLLHNFMNLFDDKYRSFYDPNILFNKVTKLLFNYNLFNLDDILKYITPNILMDIFDIINNNNKKSIKTFYNCYIFLIDFDIIFIELVTKYINT